MDDIIPYILDELNLVQNSDRLCRFGRCLFRSDPQPLVNAIHEMVLVLRFEVTDYERLTFSPAAMASKDEARMVASAGVAKKKSSRLEGECSMEEPTETVDIRGNQKRFQCEICEYSTNSNEFF